MGEEQVIKQELEAWTWMTKINDKLTLIKLKVSDHNDIEESDWDLLQILYRVFHNGEYPLYETKLNIQVQNVTEVGLFADKTTDESNGTEIEKRISEPIIDNNG